MKIAFDAKRAFRNSSGLGNYSRTIIRQLSEFYPGNEYILFTPKTGITEPGFPPGNSIIVTATGISRLFKSYWRSYSLGKLLNRISPDIYHGLSNELPLNIHKTNIRKIVTIHDLIFIRYPGLYKAVDRRIYNRKFRYAAENADIIVAASEQTKSDIIQFYNIPEKKIRVVYQSWNPAFNKIQEKQEMKKVTDKYNLPGNYIFYVGTIEERKNLLQLTKALKQTKNSIPLVVAGRKKMAYTRKVVDYVKKNQPLDVYFLANVPNTDLPALYQGADLFVYPSSFEGFGIPVLEALQSGTPVIAGEGHCLEETGGKHSVYIDPFDTEKFAASIDRVLSNTDLQKNMIRKGKEHAKMFAPEITVKNLYSVYESL